MNDVEPSGRSNEFARHETTEKILDGVGWSVCKTARDQLGMRKSYLYSQLTTNSTVCNKLEGVFGIVQSQSERVFCYFITVRETSIQCHKPKIKQQSNSGFLR